MIHDVPENLSKEFGYQVCVKCGSAWKCAGTLIDYLWCSSPSHGTIWYCPDGNAIDWEVSVDNKNYSVRWNCNCMHPKCAGRNVIFEEADYNNTYKTGVWYFDTPFTMTVDDVRAIIMREPDEWEGCDV